LVGAAKALQIVDFAAYLILPIDIVRHACYQARVAEKEHSFDKFGVRHFAVQSREGKVAEEQEGLTEPLWRSFKAMAVDSLKLKKSWTHGEIYFEFARKKNDLLASVQMESNYNMASLNR
jgi:uncharacterized protein (DUF1330 family)